MKIYQLFFGVILSFWASCGTTLHAQTGDQILDGIGETGLIARYIFDGNTKDWSRNNWHGKVQDSKGKFINDEQFGTVLSLPADSNAFVSLPGEALLGEESLTITGWFYLRSNQIGQRFFDFGKNAQSNLFASPTGTKEKEGYHAEITAGVKNKYQAKSVVLEINKWNHIALVINIPSKSISTFLNGVLVSETKNVALELNQVLDTNSAGKTFCISGNH